MNWEEPIEGVVGAVTIPSMWSDGGEIEVMPDESPAQAASRTIAGLRARVVELEARLSRLADAMGDV